MGGMMIDEYIIQGQPFDDSTAMEFLFLGANIFGATKSGAAIATDVRDFGKFVKGISSSKANWTWKGPKIDVRNGKEPFVKMNLQFFASDGGGATKPNQGQGFASKGYNPQPGERTFEGYVKQNADPEVSLYTSSSGFNNGNGDIGGQFKRFGAEPRHGIDVHQPLRNSVPNGLIFGDVGSKTKNGGVTSPKPKDIKQLYEYLNNAKYHK